MRNHYNGLMILVVLLLSCLIGKSQVINNQKKMIPIIKYTPDDFVESIRLSFLKVNKSNYIEINKNISDNSFFFNINGIGDSIYNPDNYPIWQKERILKNDSIFILHFKHIPDIRFNGRLPIKYFGKLESGEVLFFLNKPDDDRLYSLFELIIKEFGNMDSFRNEIIKNIEENLDRNMKNGIYSTDRESAILFLRDDFEFYEKNFPNDRLKISLLLLDFIDTSITCSQGQKDQIENTLKDITETYKSSMISIPSNKNELLSYNVWSDLFKRLSSILDISQLEELERKNSIRKYLMNYYINSLSKKLIWISEESDEFLIPSEHEKLNLLKNEVYNSTKVKR